MRWVYGSVAVVLAFSVAYVVAADRRDLRTRIAELEKARADASHAEPRHAEASDVAAKPATPNVKEVDAKLQTFFAEQPGTAWAGDARAQVLRAFAKAKMSRESIGSLECRGTLCRAVFGVADETQARDLMTRIRFLDWPGPMGAFMVDNESGGKSVKLFLAPQGAQLPAVN